MVRTYACDRCWENRCQNCGYILFAEKEACEMCGAPNPFAGGG